MFEKRKYPLSFTQIIGLGMLILVTAGASAVVPLQIWGTHSQVYAQTSLVPFVWPTHIDLLTEADSTITTTGQGGYSEWVSQEAGDVNGDGLADFLIGRSQLSSTGREENGVVYLVYGTNPFPANITLENFNGLGVTILGAEDYDRTGGSVSGAGDVNGDGFDDFLIGSRWADGPGNSRSSAGESYLIYGAENLPSTIDLASLGAAGVTIWGAEAHDNSGHAVSTAGDVNGDGLADFLLTALYADGPANNRQVAGESYLIYGSETLPATIDLASLGAAGVTIWGADNEDYSGWSISYARDVNEDSFDDFLIAAPEAKGPANNRQAAGESYLIYGSETLPATIDLASLGAAGVTIWGADSEDYSGWSISYAGDINEDNLADFLIGAPQADGLNNNGIDVGETYLIYGHNNLSDTLDLATFDELTGIKFTGADNWDESGSSVSYAGDVNGDGRDDFLIGAEGADGPENTRDKAGDSYLILGRTSLPAEIHLAQLTYIGVTIWGSWGSGFGSTVHGLGDINGDTWADTLVIESSQRKAQIILGEAEGVPTPTPGPSSTPAPTLPPWLTSTPYPPTPFPTATATPFGTATPTPNAPYIWLPHSCSNGPTIDIRVWGRNWPNDQAVYIYLDDVLKQIVPSGHGGFVYGRIINHNTPNGLHEVKAVSSPGLDVKTFTSPCSLTITPTPTGTATFTPTPTPTSTATFTPTSTPTSTATFTPTTTPTATATPTLTPTATPPTFQVGLPLIETK